MFLSFPKATDLDFKMGVELPKIWVLKRPLKTRLGPKGYDLGHFSWISDELGNSLCCDMDPPLESQGPVHICAGSDSSAGLTFVGLVPLSWVVSLLVGNRSFRAQSVLAGAWRAVGYPNAGHLLTLRGVPSLSHIVSLALSQCVAFAMRWRGFACELLLLCRLC